MKLDILLQNAAICIALSIASIITINGKLEDLLDTPDVFADFTSLGDTMKNINNAIANINNASNNVDGNENRYEAPIAMRLNHNLMAGVA